MIITRYRSLSGGIINVFCIATFMLFLFAGLCRAVPANPRPVEVTQPDGARIKIVLRGDEYHHWHEDAGGYTILKDTGTENWVYAEKTSSGALQAGKHKVGAADPLKLGLPRRLLDAGRVKAAISRKARIRASSPSRVLPGRSAVSAAQTSSSGFRAPILTGTMKNLVILARFSDQSAAPSQTEFNNLFNMSGYPNDGAAGSVKDYYLQVSYNKLTVESVVSPWVTLPHTQAYYGVNDADGYDLRPQEMVRDAIDALQATGFDFSQADGNGDHIADGLDIIHSGMGEEYGGNSPEAIWSHQWDLGSDQRTYNGVTMSSYHTEPAIRGNSGSGITRIGVICHEIGHFLGLPDLYDTTGNSSGLGGFCLMSDGSWNGNEGTSPAHMSAWCKKSLNWAAPAQLTVIGTKSLPRIEDNSGAMYLLRDSSFPSYEYFLVENRQGYGFDSGLPGVSRGILIWHVDESVGSNDDYTHYLVALEEASGTQHLRQLLGYYDPTVSGDDSDYFRAGYKTNFSDTTAPNSKSYTGYDLKLPISAVSATGNTMSFYLGTTDATPPTAIATVNDGTAADISRTGSLAQLSANWTASGDPETGISGYWYAIGTSAGLSNVVDWKDNGALRYVTHTGLGLSYGTTYYFGVKAVNGVGFDSAVTWSNGQLADNDYPTDVPYVYDGTSSDIRYVSSLNALSANWGASTHSSGITSYECAIGTTSGGTGISGWTSTGLNRSVTRSGLILTEGNTYYVSVRALNAIGYYSSVSVSNGQTADVTGPTARIEISSPLPAKPGALALKLIVNEAGGLSGNPALAFTPASGSAHNVSLAYLVSSTWTGSALIESFYSKGAASFAFSATDLAGNAGSTITGGGAFVIDTDFSAVPGGSLEMKAYPNPCYFNKPPFILAIKGIPADAGNPLIYIYSTAGELVRLLEKGSGIDASNNGEWNGKNTGGAKVASGLYLYLVKTGNYKNTAGKVYVFW